MTNTALVTLLLPLIVLFIVLGWFWLVLARKRSSSLTLKGLGITLSVTTDDRDLNSESIAP